MDTYNEYPIKCKTCNELLAAFSDDYENYINNGISIEEALNMLGIMNSCSRIAMMNPTIVAFNMENREVIEGFKSVSAASEADLRTDNISRPIFSNCLTTNNIQPNKINILSNTGIQNILARPNQNNKSVNLLQTISRPLQSVTAPVKTDAKLSGLELVDLDNLSANTQNLGQGIPLNQINPKEKFVDPVYIGIPTINPNYLLKEPLQYVGADKYASILNGRTYLAR